MSKPFVCVTLLVFVSVGLCVPVANEEYEDRPGFCHSGGIYIKEGETAPAPIGKCEKMICGHASQNYIIRGTCPTYKLREGCYTTPQDLSRPYPRCCPRPVCDSDSVSLDDSISSEELHLRL